MCSSGIIILQRPDNIQVSKEIRRLIGSAPHPSHPHRSMSACGLHPSEITSR